MADPEIPSHSTWLFNWFRWYSIRYARKHFHTVSVSRSSAPLPPADGKPLIFVMNHPSWWDIIIGVALCDRFRAYRHYAPIDAAMLPKYRFFVKLGFFGVEPTPRGAARFLRTTEAIFAEPFRTLWITAQGRFVDPRERPIELRPGVGYVASRLKEGWIIPIAVEYPFWEERTPEALVRFGDALPLGDTARDGREWTSAIEWALTRSQDVLAQEAIRRDPAAFEAMVSGKTGIGGFYDFWRRCKCWIRGRSFDAGHASPSVDAIKPKGNA